MVSGEVEVPVTEQARRRVSEDSGVIPLPSIPMASEESVHLLTSVKFPPPALFFANPDKKWTLSDFEKLGKPTSYSVKDKEMDAENYEQDLPATTVIADTESDKKTTEEKAEDGQGGKQDDKTGDGQQFPFISLFPQTSENSAKKAGDGQKDKMTANPVDKIDIGQEEYKEKIPVKKEGDGQTEKAVENPIEKAEVVQGEKTEGKPVRETVDGQDEIPAEKQVEKPGIGQNAITAEKPIEKGGNENGKTESPPNVQGRTGSPLRRRPVQPIGKPSQSADSWSPKNTLPNYPPVGIIRPPHTVVQLTSKPLPTPNVDIRLFDRVVAAVDHRDKEPETAETRVLLSADSRLGKPAVAHNRPSRYATEVGRSPVAQMIMLTSRPSPTPAAVHVQFPNDEYVAAKSPDTLSANLANFRT